jgi:hypothetical protein
MSSPSSVTISPANSWEKQMELGGESAEDEQAAFCQQLGESWEKQMELGGGSAEDEQAAFSQHFFFGAPPGLGVVSGSAAGPRQFRVGMRAAAAAEMSKVCKVS